MYSRKNLLSVEEGRDFNVSEERPRKQESILTEGRYRRDS